MNLKKVLFFVCLLCLTIPVMGQFVVVTTDGTVQTEEWIDPEFESMIRTYVKQFFQVTGKVYGIDDYEPEPYPLQGANIKVTCMGDTTAFDGMAADKDGSFWVYMSRRDRIKDTRLRVTISYLGMETLDTIFSPAQVKENGIQTYRIQLDSVVLRSNPLTTEEVEIVAELQRMYQRGDTVIFNADAYEMPTGSVLLDLVRRLPGLKYSDGKMTYLGRDIEEIRLNGDQFFKRDMSIALNNMPADKLKSLKVYEVPDDTLDVRSDNHLVMDMNTKQPMDRTIFANVSAGTTEKLDRHSLSADAATWKQGGSEYYASFSHSTIPSEYDYQLKTENTYGSLYMDLAFDKVVVGASGSYSSNYSEDKNSSFNKTFMPEFTQNSVSERTSSNGGHNWNGSLGVNSRMNSKQWWNLHINYSRNESTNTSSSTDSISNEGEGLVSFTRQENRTESNSNSYGVSGGYNKRFGKDDAYTFGTWFNVNATDGDNTSFNTSNSRFYQLGDSVRNVNHRILNPSKNHSYSATFSLDRSITGDFINRTVRDAYLSLRYNLTYDDGKSEQSYDDVLYGTSAPIDSLHYDRRNSNLSNSLSLSFNSTDSLRRIYLTASITPVVMTIDNDKYGSDRDEHIRYTGIRYNVSADYRIKVFRKSQLGLGYNGSNGLPDVSQLSTVTDYSDPMNIREGNSSLRNSFSHNVNAEFQFKSYLRTRINYATTIDAITTLTRLDKETGARRTSPANINGNWNMSEYLFLTYPFQDLSLSFTANHSFRHNVAYVQTYTDTELKKSATDWHQLSFNLSGGYSNRSWMINAETGYSIDRSKSDYLENSSGGRRFTARGELSYQAPFGLGASTTCNYDKPFGYEMAEANRAECLWNISLEYSFLKQRQAEVRLTWRDILNQYNGFSATVSGTNWNESRTYGDTSMFVITFSYRLNDFR